MIGYLNIGTNLLLSNAIPQQVKDEAVSELLAYVFSVARKIFESPGAPVFMCQELGTPFYRLIETSLKVLSESYCL